MNMKTRSRTRPWGEVAEQHFSTEELAALEREVEREVSGPPTERPALLCLDGWAGRVNIRVAVIGETAKRYRVRLEEAAHLPSRRFAAAGDVVMVPRYAVRLGPEAGFRDT